MEINVDYSKAEKVALAIILFSDNIKEEFLNNFFYYTNENMFIDKMAKATYIAIKDNYKRISDMIGTKHFAYNINLIVEIETGVKNYIYSFEDEWVSSVTMKNWITRIQNTYFEMKFKNAKNEKEFNEIIREKDKYIITTEMTNISDDGENILKNYEERKKTAIFTPYPSINEIVGSLQGGDMVVLAGSSGGGKTCMMLNLATGIAKQGKKVDIFSLEMPKSQLQQRIICSEALIDASKFRAFSLTPDEKKKFDDYATNDFKKMNISIFKKQTVGIEEIRRIERKSKSDIIFIDYLGLIDSFSNKSSYEKYSEISRNIKLLAMETNKPVICLHQLNRNFQEREDKKPKTSDLRDSGKIEQDADMIWFVYRPSLFDNKHPEDEIVFIVAKNRHGEVNKEVSMRFVGKYQKVFERKKYEIYSECKTKN